MSDRRWMTVFVAAAFFVALTDSVAARDDEARVAENELKACLATLKSLHDRKEKLWGEATELEKEKMEISEVRRVLGDDLPLVDRTDEAAVTGYNERVEVLNRRVQAFTEHVATASSDMESLKSDTARVPANCGLRPSQRS